MTDCPTDEQLAQLAHGRIRGPELDSLEAHVDGCSACRKLLATVSNGSAPPMQPERGVLSPGDKLGRYEIERLLAAGGMGMLYIAQDTQLRRRVALKLMRPAFGGDLGRVRLLREAQAMAALAHPNVIGVYELGEVDGRVFVAMELVEGGTLREWMKKPGSTWRDVVELFVAAGKGLSAAHHVGVIHRDFKPENVLVSRDGTARVADFGLARPEVVATEEPPRDLPMKITHTGTLLGTPAYMSPEQLAGRPADARSDQYSFCVCLYEALAGKRPFPADTLEELRARVTGGMPPPPKDGLVPAHVWATIARGLHPDPAQRFPDMNALLTVLAFNADVAPQRTPTGWWRSLGGASAALLVGGIVLGGGIAAIRAPRQGTAAVTTAPTAMTAPTASAAPAAPDGVQVLAPRITLPVGSTHALHVPGVQRVAVGDDSIVSVAPMQNENTIVLSGNTPGTTTLLVWTRSGRLESTVTVSDPDERPPPPADRISLATGEHKTVTVPEIARLAVGDASICDVRTMGQNQIELTGGVSGATTLLVWKRDGTRVSYDVHVHPPRP